MFEENKKRLLIAWPRRSGKDIAAFHCLLYAALQRPGLYYMCYPTFAQGKRIYWQGRTNDGLSFLSFIPPELVKRKNEQLMQVVLYNDSIIQCVGGDDPSSLVGINLFGCVFSEFSICNPAVYTYLRPSLTAINGFALFVSTPRGKNEFWKLLKIGQENPDSWFTEVLTVEDTKHISLDLIKKELESGEMSEDMVLQEYYCDFSRGCEGSFYSRYIDKMRNEGRITNVPHSSSHRVNVAFDLGFSDATCLIFWQNVGPNVHIINAYSNSDKSLSHYVKILADYKDKYGYIYNKFYFPHDCAVHELSSGVSRIETLRSLGVSPLIVLPNLSIQDGIEAVRAALSSKVWIDEGLKDLINALESYRSIWDPVLGRHRDTPLHDWASNYADAFRYATISFPKSGNGLSPEELDARFKASRAIPGSIGGAPLTDPHRMF